jgi:hypothetical protein
LQSKESPTLARKLDLYPLHGYSDDIFQELLLHNSSSTEIIDPLQAKLPSGAPFPIPGNVGLIECLLHFDFLFEHFFSWLGLDDFP